MESTKEISFEEKETIVIKFLAEGWKRKNGILKEENEPSGEGTSGGKYFKSLLVGFNASKFSFIFSTDFGCRYM